MYILAPDLELVPSLGERHAQLIQNGFIIDAAAGRDTEGNTIDGTILVGQRVLQFGVEAVSAVAGSQIAIQRLDDVAGRKVQHAGNIDGGHGGQASTGRNGAGHLLGDDRIVADVFHINGDLVLRGVEFIGSSLQEISADLIRVVVPEFDGDGFGDLIHGGIGLGVVFVI